MEEILSICINLEYSWRKVSGGCFCSKIEDIELLGELLFFAAFVIYSSDS